MMVARGHVKQPGQLHGSPPEGHAPTRVCWEPAERPWGLRDLQTAPDSNYPTVPSPASTAVLTVTCAVAGATPTTPYVSDIGMPPSAP